MDSEIQRITIDQLLKLLLMTVCIKKNQQQRGAFILFFTEFTELEEGEIQQSRI